MAGSGSPKCCIDLDSRTLAIRQNRATSKLTGQPRMPPVWIEHWGSPYGNYREARRRLARKISGTFEFPEAEFPISNTGRFRIWFWESCLRRVQAVLCSKASSPASSAKGSMMNMDEGKDCMRVPSLRQPVPACRVATPQQV
jgi:hypothetical protein